MKNEQNITCPSCRHAFPLDLALKEHLRGELTTELTRAFDKRLSTAICKASQAQALCPGWNPWNSPVCSGTEVPITQNGGRPR